jgi:hypothetical protein
MGETALLDIFDTVIEELKTFTLPVLGALARGEKLMHRWRAGSGWVAS